MKKQISIWLFVGCVVISASYVFAVSAQKDSLLRLSERRQARAEQYRLLRREGIGTVLTGWKYSLVGARTDERLHHAGELLQAYGATQRTATELADIRVAATTKALVVRFNSSELTVPYAGPDYEAKLHLTILEAARWRIANEQFALSAKIQD